jgi:D-glycero-D-manno-heptose 1,7-bisphosphate phosphatase
MGIDGVSAPRRAVFLDRDGTLNRAYLRDGVLTPPWSESEVEILPGVPQALADLRAAGFALVVVTNQPDVARGTLSREVADRINQHIAEELQVDRLLTCFHDGHDGCACRKPAAGMLEMAAGQLNLDLGTSFLIGDRWKDTEAGRRAGCTTIQLRTADVGDSIEVEPDYWAADMPEAARIVMQHAGIGSESKVLYSAIQAADC